MACSITNPVACVAGPILGPATSGIVNSAWDSICKSFADAATSILQSFAKAFVSIPNVDLASSGLRNVYAISLGLASLVAVLLLLGQVIRTAITHDGSALATGLVGVGKAALAFMLTLTVASTALLASDEITRFIVDNTFGGTKEFSDNLAKLIAWDPSTSGSLLLIFGILGILLTAVLWFEMLLRNAAIAVLIATSPISAAGMVSEGTKEWWSKLVTATVQLIILKPVIALVFALGFSLAGDSQDLETTLSGMLVLLLAAVAWPTVARFFSFASVQAGGAAGLGAVLGFAGGRMSAGGGGGPAGMSPEEFGGATADRTMASFASKGGAGQAAAGAGAGGASQAAGAAAGGPIGAIAMAGLQLAQKASATVAGGMDKMAGHAGYQGPQQYGTAAGPGVRGGASPASSGSGQNSEKTSGWADSPYAAAPAGGGTNVHAEQDTEQALLNGTPSLPVTSAPPDDGSQNAEPFSPSPPAAPQQSPPPNPAEPKEGGPTA
ncbi:hypothetical protein [Streptomyces sp. NPDC008317]|uniref:hypothetical protein n=1 Tax=Streptomyces sp. NPDC008317 TaxID=3364827 RepID=UPI0036E2E969